MENEKITWGIFFSGGGRCAKDCLDLLTEGRLRGHKIKCVVTAGQPAGNLKHFSDNQITIIDRYPGDFGSITEYQIWLADILQKNKIDYLFLLGYKYRIRPELLVPFKNRILNIHPSLLPSFKNTQTAIQDAMDLGARVSGVTTHLIDEKIDEGFILDQEAVRIPRNTNFITIDIAFNKAGIELIERTFNLVKNEHKPKIYLDSYIKEHLGRSKT